MDTQWPRFIVFQQHKAGEPHQYAGSVHAPDAEMALMNARDVFVRRPACVSLWVAPVAAIFAKTAEELAENPTILETDKTTGAEAETYHVFQKATHKGTYAYVGDVTAETPALALKAAFESAAAWWVLPAKSVTRTTPEDIEALFQPALSKTFRDQAFYHTVAAMQRLHTQTQDTAIDEP
jgi:ring-1,2-phenylacetyl-CoA epoxidase subunit PaaB